MKRLKRLQESSSESRGVFRTQARNDTSIMDVRLGYIQASENIEILKMQLRWSKSSRLSQRVAFPVNFDKESFNNNNSAFNKVIEQLPVSLMLLKKMRKKCYTLHGSNSKHYFAWYILFCFILSLFIVLYFTWFCMVFVGK